jgi:uncharacterized protein YdaU (DUF1376 family)
MTWRQYAVEWRKKHFGDNQHLSREQVGQYIVAVTKYYKATQAGRSMLLLRLLEAGS